MRIFSKVGSLVQGLYKQSHMAGWGIFQAKEKATLF
ncbi:hypothetical protein [Aeromonas phage 4L372D]|uniref:Uncharacterized protein n=1 Tax=Aeromonas phage 4L372D TaxID=2588518 RepID=A0A5B9N462_9CAUD|nr:hypothetical protein HWC27_gp151 [Aeromonas phage 4L372D]QEG08704.1 hypothetical protein [Aeromonas phage 4L372D]